MQSLSEQAAYEEVYNGIFEVKATASDIHLAGEVEAICKAPEICLAMMWRDFDDDKENTEGTCEEEVDAFAKVSRRPLMT